MGITLNAYLKCRFQPQRLDTGLAGGGSNTQDGSDGGG